MQRKIFLVSLILTIVQGCQKTSVVEQPYIRISVVGEIYEGDWLEVNDWHLRFILPDTTEATDFNMNYNPYLLKISAKNSKLGLLCPTKTYMLGPGKPVKMKVSQGMMLLNIAKILNKLSKAEYDSSVFDYKSDRISALNGLLVFGMKNGELVKVTYPSSMNILIEPYVVKSRAD